MQNFGQFLAIFFTLGVKSNFFGNFLGCFFPLKKIFKYPPPHIRHCVTFNLLGGHILLITNRLCFIGTSRSNRIFPKCLALKSVLEGVSQKSSGTQYLIACMVCPGEHILTGCDIVIQAVIETLEDKSPPAPIFEITVVITLHGSLLVSNWKM